MPTQPLSYYSNLRLMPYWNPDLARTMNVQIGPSQNIARGTVLGQKTESSAAQVVTVTGTPTGGTFTISMPPTSFYPYSTTAVVPYNATAAQLQATLQALPGIGNGNVTCTGGPLPGTAITCTFGGALANQPLPLMIVNGAGLTGGASPAVTVTATQTLTLTGSTIGGTFALSFGGQKTAAIVYTGAAATIQAALRLLTTLGTAVACTGGALGSAGAPSTPVTVTFTSPLPNNAPLTLLIPDNSLLTGTTPAVTTTSSQTGIESAFYPYNTSNTDGTQTALAIAQYDMQTDASGNITLSAASGQAGMDQGFTLPNVGVYIAGYFDVTELTGLDSGAITSLGRIVEGNSTQGVLHVG